MKLLTNSWHGLPFEPPDFCGMDSRENWQLNLKRQPEDWIWRTRPVRYTVNSQGYRCPEWDQISWADSVLMFGCSYVFGVGIDDQDTMAHQLSLALSAPVINLGQGATDDTFQWVNSTVLAHAGIRPRAVIYLWPGVHRLTEFLGQGRVNNWGPWNAHMNPMAANWVTNETHIWEYLSYLSLNVRTLWSCPVLEYYPYMYPPDQRGTIKPWGCVLDAARDVAPQGAYHPGIETNLGWVRSFLLPDLAVQGIRAI